MSRIKPPSCGSLGEAVIPQNPTQTVTLAIDPELLQQHRSLLDCVAGGIYRQRGGVTAVAGRLDCSPSHLSEKLGGGGARNRKFGVDELEAYIAEYGDLDPIRYLIARFIPGQHANSLALAQLDAQLTQLQQQVRSLRGGGQ